MCPGDTERSETMNSPEELVRKTINAVNNPELLHIVESSDSPSVAEKTAKDREYPLFLVKETEQLAVLKQNYSQVFDKVTKDKPKNSKDNFSRIFPCLLKEKHSQSNEFEVPGKLCITLHPFLPPLFGNYQIYSEDDGLLFSCDPSIPLEYETEKNGVECVLSASSKSLPVNLTIKARRGYGYENNRQLTFERKLEDCSIIWTRVIPRQLKDKSFSPIESYERITSWNNQRSRDDCVILRNLGLEERKLCKYTFLGDDPYCLFLVSQFRYPAGINSSLLFRVQTIYSFYSLSKKHFEEFGCRKIEELPLPTENPMWFNTLKNNEILLSMRFFDKEISCREYSQEPIQEHIGEIIENTPSYIDGLKALWNYYGFKETEPRIYNHGESCQMLPPWGKK